MPRYPYPTLPPDVTISALSAVDDELLSAFQVLMPQLNPSLPAPDASALASILSSPAVSLLAARLDGVIVGVLTLAVFPAPTGIRAWVEDVVVDQAARGRGIGEALTRWALALAAERGAKSVELTSRPARAAANRLYQRLGFTQPQTNYYRYPFTE